MKTEKEINSLKMDLMKIFNSPDDAYYGLSLETLAQN